MPTIEEIYNSMIAEKESGNYPELDELNSNSKVAVWRLMLFVVAFISKSIHALFDSFKAEIERIFAVEQIGTIEWWVDRVGKFQYGDELQFADSVFKYLVIDESKRIVKRVALETRQFVLYFKTAKDDGSGNLTPLDQSEKDALQAYVNKIKMPGTYTGIISENADNLKIWLRIYYNAEVTEAELNTSVSDAIVNYIDNVVFNSKFTITNMIDELQKLRGVENPVSLKVEAKAFASPVTDYAVIADYYIPAAGYSELTELNIEYIQNV
jgi:hypothetical protein